MNPEELNAVASISEDHTGRGPNYSCNCPEDFQSQHLTNEMLKNIPYLPYPCLPSCDGNNWNFTGNFQPPVCANGLNWAYACDGGCKDGRNAVSEAFVPCFQFSQHCLNGSESRYTCSQECSGTPEGCCPPQLYCPPPYYHMPVFPPECFREFRQTDHSEETGDFNPDGQSKDTKSNQQRFPPFPPFPFEPYFNSLPVPPFASSSTFEHPPLEQCYSQQSQAVMGFSGDSNHLPDQVEALRRRGRGRRRKTDDAEESSEVEGLYSCILCEHVGNDVTKFLEHIDSHATCGPPFVCKVCYKDFRFILTWRNHIISHMSLRPFKCPECRATYITNGELIRHRRYKHNGGKPHKCIQCDYECVELAKMNRHKRMHEGEKPFKCPSCEYTSYDKSKIRRHYVTHTREKPFECEFCHSRFTQSGSLKTHLTNVHAFEKVEFRCTYCSLFVTANMGELRNHMKLIHRATVFPVTVNRDIIVKPEEEKIQS